MEKSYTLIVLNGPLARRSIRLPPGETRIGGEDPDLAVALEDAHTATLTVGTEGVRISTDASCWIDGAPAVAPDVAPLDRVIDLGGLAFVLRDSATDDVAPPCLIVPPRRKGRRAGAALAVLITSVAVLGASSLALERVFWAPATVASAARQADPLSDIRKRLAPEGIVLSEDERGVVNIRGQCMVSSRLAALRDALRESGFVYRDSVICQDDIVNSVTAILRMNGYDNANVESGTTYGTVDISGRIDADERWQRVAEMLSGTAGLQSWTVRDRSGGSVNDLISRLRAAGLIGKLSISRARNDILVTGLLDATDKAALTAVIAAFRRDYSGAARVVVQDIAAAPSLNRVFPSAVVSFGGRPPSMFIELADGARLTVGSRLPGGYAITGLDASGVDLSKDGEIAHFPLNL